LNLGQKAKVKRQKAKVLDQINLHFISIFQNNSDSINFETNFLMLASMVLTLKFWQAHRQAQCCNQFNASEVSTSSTHRP
jgi:hypothetical protein